MIKPIQAIIRMLQGRVILTDSTDVRIIKRDYPIDKTPCITIDNSGGTATIQKNITNMDLPIPSTHPQYDPNKPDKKISQQVIREEHSITLSLNIWCDTEEQREEIVDKISQLFYLVQSDHYSFCGNYNNGNCTYLNQTCKVDNTTGRGVKGQCPKPTEYHYKNIFTIFDIIRATFDVAPAYILDDLTTTPPTLRSIMKVSFSYYDYHIIGGAISDNLTVDERLI